MIFGGRLGDFKYYDMDELRGLVDRLKSEIGQVDLLEDSAQLIIRDRSEYVLEMLKVLVHTDLPVPLCPPNIIISPGDMPKLNLSKSLFNPNGTLEKMVS